MRNRFAGGLAALAVVVGAMALHGGPLVADQGSERTISLTNIHTKETITVAYKKAGRYVPAAMERVNWVLRDWRRNEPTAMDPELVDLLWEMHRELGSKEPIHVISGYRSRGTNSMLQSTRGGQASNSQHINGKAADVHFPDVPVQRLRYSALVRERGGVGYYPTSAIPFVHVDTARVRAWPRLPRTELAQLFPSGRSQHIPDDGSPLTSSDAREGRTSRPRGELAAFLDLRRNGGAPSTLVASATRSGLRSTSPQGWTPTLVEVPQQVALAPRALPRGGPTAADRASLAELAAMASLAEMPRLVRAPAPARRPNERRLVSLSGTPAPMEGLTGQQAPAPGDERRLAAIDPALFAAAEETTDSRRFRWAPRAESLRWVPSAEFDEEHPDELSYRPFRIAPLLTETAEAPLLADFVAHDPGRTLDLLDQPISRLPLRLRPTSAVAAMAWAGSGFQGAAVGLDRLEAALEQATSGVRSRAVRVSAQ